MKIIYTLKEIEKAVKEVWEYGKPYKVWAFYAEMGSGKTTFIHSLCQFLDVKDAINSPTYAIINEYKSDKVGKIYHSDWYRLKNEEEAINAGVEDMLNEGSLCLIEWPEKGEGLLADATFRITIEVVDEQTRSLSF